MAETAAAEEARRLKRRKGRKAMQLVAAEDDMSAQERLASPVAVNRAPTGTLGV